MWQRAEWVRRQREEAWAFGRRLRKDLLSRYQHEYGEPVPPAPAKVIDDLLTDFLGVTLRFEPLNADRFAETRWADGKIIVTVNSRTGDITGVKDIEGVQNVAKWHEAVHAVRDVDVLRAGPQGALPGFEAPRQIVCYRTPERLGSAEERGREFWAEEAGRAAAVSLPALAHSESFKKLMRLQAAGPTRVAWPLLYEAAEQIGVNITALVKQLSLEGSIIVTKMDGQSAVCVQPVLLDRMDTTRE